MNKLILGFSILFSQIYFAVAEDCLPIEELNQLANTAKEFTLPNCATREAILDANKKKNASYELICGQCKTDFESKVRLLGFKVPKVNTTSPEELAGNEFKKSISALLLEITKLRSAYPFNSEFTEAQKSCNLGEMAKETASCSGAINFESLKDQAADELAYLLSNPPQNGLSGLLNRESFTPSSQQCNQISESQILSIKSELAFQSLTPDIVEAFANIPLDSTNIASEIRTILKENASLNDVLNSNPIISDLLKDPTRFRNFFGNTPKPTNKDSLRGYFSNQSTAKSLDESLANKCRNSFKAYKEVICPGEIKSGNYQLGKLSNLRLFKTTPDPINEDIIKSSEFNKPDGDLQKNIDLFQICSLPGHSNKTGLDLSKEIGKISFWLPDEISDRPFDLYRIDKFKSDVQSTRELLCNIESGKVNCSGSTGTDCQLYKLWQTSLKDKNSIEHRLANSSDEGINSLLRSMIGGSKGTSPETAKVLIANGILPKSDGKFVEQPKVAEREPNYFQKTAPSVAPTFATTTSQAARPSSATPTYSNDNFYKPAAAEISASPETAVYDAPISTNLLQSMKDLSQINGEIARRLLGSNSQSQSTISRSDVRSIAESVLKDQQQAPTTAMVDNTVDDFFNEINQKRAPVGGGFGQGTAAPAKQSQREIDAFRKAQMNKALEGMGQGSRDVAMANAASDVSVKVQEGKDKEAMSKVEVFTSADKLEKVNLAEILKLKGQKDAEGKRLIELVKKKENFILNVNKTSLMVKFNDSKDGFEIIRIGSSGSKIDDKVVSEVRSFIKENYSGVALSDLRKNLVQ